MNVFYISENLIDLSIKELKTMASFKELGIGDVVVCRFDRLFVLLIINHWIGEKTKLTEYPILAQVICETENLPKLLPILYYNNGYSCKIFDIGGLQFLQKLFISEKLVLAFFIETISLAKGKIYQRDVQLAIKLLHCQTKKRLNDQFVVSTKPQIQKDGKLLIVEKFFTPQMKQEFYNSLTLGLTERETLVKLRRKYPKIFSKILLEFKDTDVYTKI